MTLCTLKKKSVSTLKNKLKIKHKIFLIKKKTKKYYRYISWNLRKKRKSITIK